METIRNSKWSVFLEAVEDVSCTRAGETISIESFLAGAAVCAGSVDTVSIGVAVVVLCGALVQIYTQPRS